MFLYVVHEKILKHTHLAKSNTTYKTHRESATHTHTHRVTHTRTHSHTQHTHTGTHTATHTRTHSHTHTQLERERRMYLGERGRRLYREGGEDRWWAVVLQSQRGRTCGKGAHGGSLSVVHGGLGAALGHGGEGAAL